MLSPIFNHLLIPFLIAMFLAVNMGGSGTGPSFSAAFGANAIRRSAIAGLFGIMVFLGALLAGKGTAMTISNDLLDPHMMSYSVVSIILFAVSISLLVANLFGIPQSTSQSTVLAVTAAAVYFDQFHSNRLFVQIIPAWFILPVISFVLCFMIGKYIYKPIRKRGYFLSVRLNQHPALRMMIIIMSCYVAFSIGANNVANASGPIASMIIKELNLEEGGKSFILVLILSTLVVAPVFGIGSSVFGRKILQNTGKEIILFGKIEAVIIAFVSASLLLLASITKGIPTSLVQLNVAAILGIGVAKLGFKNIFRKTEVNKFFVMWIIAPAIAFFLCLLLLYLAEQFGYLIL